MLRNETGGFSRLHWKRPNLSLRGRQSWTALGFERNIVILGLSSALGSFGNLLWFFFLPIILESQGLSPIGIGTVYGIIALVSVGIQIPAGAILVDRWGRKRTIVLGGLLSAVSVAAIGLSGNLLTTVIAYIVWGLAGSVTGLAINALIMDSAPQQRRAAGFGAFYQLAGLAATASPLVGSLFLVRNEQYVIFLASALLTLGSTAVRAVLLREAPRRPGARNGAVENKASGIGTSLRDGLSSTVRSRTIIALTLAYAFYNLFLSSGSNTFTLVVSLYSKDALHLEPLYLGLMFGLANLFATQFSILFGRLADRHPRERIIALSWSTEMAFMMAFAYSYSPVLALSSFSLWMFFGAMDSPALMALIGDVSPSERRGITLGFFRTFTNILAVPALFFTGVLFMISHVLPFYANLSVGLLSLGFFVYAFVAKRPARA
ncbi:MAG: MFS transporter [Nitrososphaerota archaeon]|nr:MFS transporter [Nitrososphaerota archaeon]